MWLLPRIGAFDEATFDVPVRAIARDGLVTLTRGRAVRVIALPIAQALEIDRAALTAGVAAAIDRLQPGEALQWYVELGSDGQRACFAVVGGDGPERTLERADALRAALAALGLRPRLLDGPEAARLLLRRVLGDGAATQERPVEVTGALDPRQEAAQARSVACRLLERLAARPIEPIDGRLVSVGHHLEQTVFLAGAAADETLGWPASALRLPLPSLFSLHVRDGAATLLQTVRATGPNPRASDLVAVVDELVDDGLEHGGIRIDRGEFVQHELWQATLPLGLAPGELLHAAAPHVVAAVIPLLGDSCGSPEGVPLARGAGGRIEHLDPWDPIHRRPAIALAGARTGAALRTLVERLAAAGVVVVIAVLDDVPELRDLAPQISPADALTPAGDDAIIAIGRYGGGPLVCAGAALAVLDRLTDLGARRGALVLACADALVTRPDGARWLRDATAGPASVVATVHSLLTVATAGLLDALPVQLLFRHDDEDVEPLVARLRLGASAGRALRELDDATDAPALLWRNGARGSAAVRLLPASEVLA